MADAHLNVKNAFEREVHRTWLASYVELTLDRLSTTLNRTGLSQASALASEISVNKAFARCSSIATSLVAFGTDSTQVMISRARGTIDRAVKVSYIQLDKPAADGQLSMQAGEDRRGAGSRIVATLVKAVARTPEDETSAVE